MSGKKLHLLILLWKQMYLRMVGIKHMQKKHGGTCPTELVYPTSVLNQDYKNRETKGACDRCHIPLGCCIPPKQKVPPKEELLFISLPNLPPASILHPLISCSRGSGSSYLEEVAGQNIMICAESKMLQPGARD